MRYWKYATYLLYADDTVVFCNAKPEEISYLRVMLIIFQAISGLKPEGKQHLSHKWCFTNSGVGQTFCVMRWKIYLLYNLGCLWVQITQGTWNLGWHSWENWKKLALWQPQYLSLRGRLILINSVLNSLLTYVMPQFPMPSKVIRALGRMRRNYLWHGNKGQSI